MFQDDYIMRQIEMLTRFIGNVLLQGDTTDTGISVDEEGYIVEGDFLSYRLNGLLLEGKINEAEICCSRLSRNLQSGLILKRRWIFMRLWEVSATSSWSGGTFPGMKSSRGFRQYATAMWTWVIEREAEYGFFVCD